MSDTPRQDQENPEVPKQVEKSADSVQDLPEKPVNDQEAQGVKGGVDHNLFPG
jgi:hypothetical protein